MAKRKTAPPIPETTTVEIPLSFESPESSLVKAATYDPKTQELSVTLPQRTYIYTYVDEGTWQAFLHSDSKGQFFNRRIRVEFRVRV